MKVLFIDCCIRGEQSRTKKLCDEFIKRILTAHPDYELETLVLKEEKLYPYREEDVNRRNDILKLGIMDHAIFNYANQFAEAGRIIIGAPYYDLSFPSLLKIYIEHIFVTGITFVYEGSRPVGLCKAQKMMYIQTAGGFTEENEPGAVYLKAVADMLGIPEFERICADGLDIAELEQGPEYNKAVEKIRKTAPNW